MSYGRQSEENSRVQTPSSAEDFHGPRRVSSSFELKKISSFRRLAPLCMLDRKTSTDDENFKSIMLEEEQTEEKLIELCRVRTVTNIGANVTCIEFADQRFSEFNYARNYLFVRSFYDDLLCATRSRSKTVLIGNPRTSTSSFQYYYLARIFNPDKFGKTVATALPPDSHGCTRAPEFVVRQLGDERLELCCETVRRDCRPRDTLRCNAPQKVSSQHYALPLRT